jgi:hypothetical protein
VTAVGGVLAAAGAALGLPLSGPEELSRGRSLVLARPSAESVEGFGGEEEGLFGVEEWHGQAGRGQDAAG